MRRKKEEKLRIQRICAGIEEPLDGEMITIENDMDDEKPSVQVVYKLSYVVENAEDEDNVVVEVIEQGDEDADMEMIEIQEEDEEEEEDDEEMEE